MVFVQLFNLSIVNFCSGEVDVVISAVRCDQTYSLCSEIVYILMHFLLNKRFVNFSLLI